MRNELNRRRRHTGLAGLGAIALGLAALLPPVRAWAQQTVCAVVKLQLGQQAALEREAFKANLGLTNNLGDLPLSQLRIDVLITDPSGSPANSLFFIKTTNLQNVNAVDGTGTVQPAGSAAAEWLIIPSTGAGGSGTAGVKYNVTARMSFYTGGVPRITTTFPVAITVKPQPVLFLEYALPFEVFGPQPLLPSVSIATEPFPLGLRVVNVGSGTASNFTVNSAQPQIVDNAQGLAVNFTLLGSYLGSTALTSNSLNIAYGDVPAGGSKQAAWIMASSLAGRFNNFSANFTHAATLGGALTSLIQGVSTYTLIKDVQDDTPGRDAQFDFLINRTTPRSQMEQTYASGADPLPTPEFIMESDQAGMTPVLDVPGTTGGALSGSNAVLNFAFAVPVPTAAWVHAAVPVSFGGSVQVLSAVRADGKVLNPHNFWISKHFNKLSLAFSYKLHVLDFTGAQAGAASYALTFGAASLDVPPDPIPNLSTGAAGPGAVNLAWTATGEDGSTGTVVGGKYAIFASTDLAATPSAAAAAVVFSTSTPALAPQNYRLTGLLGNATYQIAVFLADAAGHYAPASNRVSITLPAAPPRSVTVVVGTTSAALNWDIAGNLPGVQYNVLLSTSGAAPLAQSGFAVDRTSFIFTGLDVNQTYLVTAQEKVGAAQTPDAAISSATTLALAPAVSTAPFVAVATNAVTAQWLAGANPPDTEFLAELSTSPSRAPLLLGSGWVHASSFTFAGLLPATTYYGQVKARNRASVETAYADLGAIKTAPVDNLPPRTSFAAGTPQFGASPVYVATTTVLSLSAADDKVAAGDGLGLGVARTLFAVDSASFTAYTGTFTLVAVGTHTIQFYSVDVLGDAEVVRSTSVAVDAAAPIARLDALGSSTTVAGNLFAAFGSSLAVTAIDPVVAGAASGVAGVQLTVDGATAAYTAPFELAAGTHSIAFGAFDNLGNGLNVLSTETVAVDGLPPRTAAAFGEPKFAGDRLYLSSTTPVQFTAVDDLATVGDGRGSGVGQTFLAVDATTYAAVVSTISFSTEGVHGLSWFSRDLVGHEEIAASTSVAVDLTPPLTQLQISSPSVAQASATVVGPGTVLSLAAQDPLSGGVASGVKDTYLAVSTSVFALAPATFTFSGADGPRAVSFYSRDNVLNTEAVKTAAVLLDATPPLTVLQVLGGRRFPGPDAASAYVSSDTRFAFAALDPTVGGVSAGAAFTQSSDNGGAFLASTTTFSLAEGRHALAYQSQDLVGNMEVARSTTMLVDATPPVSTVTIGTPQFTAADGTIYLATTTPVALSAVDPALPQISTGTAVPGSGVARIEVSVDSAPYAVYTTSLTFAEGRHTIQYRAIDNVGNAEAARTLAVQSDATPPLAAPVLAGGRQAAGTGGVFVSSDTRVSFAAADPIVNGVASGVAFTRWHDDGGAFSAFVSSFALAEGSHTLTFQSQDNVGNLEVLKSTAILVDATPPVSAAAIGAPLYTAADGTQYVTPATPVTSSAADPVVNGAASGIDRIEAAVDGAPFAVYTSTLTFAEGRHTVSYRTVDRVGNVETAHTLRLQSDSTAPVTTLQASGSYFAAAGRNFAPPSFAYALPAQDPVVNGVASGLAATLFRIDVSSFTRYVSTFSLNEGVRRVDFQSADNVGNQELLKSATVYVDATAPATALTIGQPQYASPSGMLFVGPAAPFALSAQDPVVQGVASGVSAVSVRVDSAPFAFYSATFTLTPGDGLRTVGWFAADNVGNAETPKLSTVALDATPPLTSLLVTGGRQFPGPDASTFYASADTRLILVSTDPLAGGVASGVAFTRWQDNNGAFTTSISSLALAEGAHTLGYQSSDNVANLEVLRSTTALIDATPPATTVAIGSPTFTAADGTIYVATATPVAFAAADPDLPTGQAGSGLNRIEVSLDGAPFMPYTIAITLTEGRHVILYRAVDNVGNIEGAHSISIQSDMTPPVSALVVGAPQFQLSNVLLVSSRTPFGVAAVDPAANNVASGVKDTYYRVSDVAPSTAAFTVYTSTFAMAGADVNKIVEFYSRDNVLNTEIVKSSTVLLDSTPPEIALLSPAACDSGICRVLKGKFPVLGTAHDLHFGNYRLEFAAGQNAVSSFTFVSSGTAVVSSNTLAVWDATALAGWYTLRLTATDLVANTASAAINVFVGDPGELLTLGNHEVFNMPEGVAAGSDGKIYVADRDNDRVAVFSSTGALLASFGSRGHDDDHLSSTGTVTLDEPSGVAVDAVGNIYVADTDHDRVLKLSATGQILLSLGGREREQEDRHDDKSEDHDRRQPGRFHHPAGVAVDAGQNIFVADTDNRRVQVFDSTGGFSFQFDLPPVPARTGSDDDDHDVHEDPSVAALGKPFGIALDAAGDIYVADPKGGRALKFGATGQLLLTIPIAGDKPGTWGQPFGVAVSASGDCLLVSDRKGSRILKFDFMGSQNLVFGAKGKLHDDDAPKPGTAAVFEKPMGLALDAQGALLVADRNNDRVRKFALPTGQPPLVVPTPKPEDEDAARDVVDKEDGGKVERKDLAAVDIPAGAVARDMKVTVSTPSEGVVDESSRRHAADAAQLKTASPPVEYGPEGTKFAAPVTLTLPYSPDLVALEGVDEADLTVRYWNRDKAQWENLDSTVNPKTRTVKAKTTHFSLYQVFSGTATAGLRPLAVGDPTFVFHDAYAFPNPVRGTSAVTIRMQTGLADSVEVRAYDVSGRRVYSSSNFSLNPGLDDGNGKGIQYTYDNVWDISGVGSGVYQYVITAKKSGKSDIHKAGRVGVIK
ncbi:MAG: hypothetical protein KGJ84_01375 [Elusimicrobia bacterium]|nr:hypothetical protein [Elusimicrobiota bacterium]